MLRSVCGDDEQHYALARDLIAVEHRYRHHQRRAGLFPAIDGVLRRYTFASEAEAVAAQQTEAEEQLRLLAPDVAELPNNLSAVRRARLLETLDDLAAGGGPLGNLAKQAAADVRSAERPGSSAS